MQGTGLASSTAGKIPLTRFSSFSCDGLQREYSQMNRKGFTLIELLIVVVIIGILAAIAIPKFANTKAKAYIASMKSDLRNLVTAEEAYFADSVKYTATTACTTPPTAGAVTFCVTLALHDALPIFAAGNGGWAVTITNNNLT